MNEVIAARLAEVLAKQRPYQHAAVVLTVRYDREHPDWIEDRYHIGSHDECEQWFYNTIAADPAIAVSRGTCMMICLQ